MLRQVTWSLPPPHAVDAWDSDAEPAKRRILIYFCLVEILFVLVPLFQTVSLPNSTDFIFFCFLEAALAIILAIAFINFQVARFIGFLCAAHFVSAGFQSFHQYAYACYAVAAHVYIFRCTDAVLASHILSRVSLADSIGSV